MQVTETNTEGLKRELEVVIARNEINEKFTDRLDKMKSQVQLKGFRKGKVPVAHLKKLYGRAVMAEILEQTVNESSSEALKERNERPAMQPAINLPEDETEVEQIMKGERDLTFSMLFEVLPDIEVADFSTLTLERLVAEASEAEVEEALQNLLERNTAYEAEEGREASDGDRVTMDFVGKIDGEAFQGGSGEGIPLVLGQGQFIPGFEDGLKGVKAGDERTVEANFPDDYQAEHLAGKDAVFDVKVTEVAAPKTADADDEFAKTLGVDSIDNLRSMLKEQLEVEYTKAARMKLKRELLDELERIHDFELPPSLVKREFEGIWNQLNEGLKQAGKTFEDEGKSEEDTRKEYEAIAERRVRLGLVIGEIGDKNKIEVSQEELRDAILEQARQYPGQEKAVYEYYTKQPGALAELRAPIFEDKVVDFILELAKPTEKTLTKDELLKAVEETTSEAQST